MAIAVAPVQMAAAHLRIDHQHRACAAEPHRVDRSLDTESGRGAGHVHVVREPLNAEQVLDLDRQRRVRTRHVRTRSDHEIDVGSGAARAFERSEEHTSELQSLMRISYAVFCLNNKKNKIQKYTYNYATVIRIHHQQQHYNTPK